MNEWKNFSDRPKDDKTYLVSCKNGEGQFFRPLLAYYMIEDDSFFPLDTVNAFPIKVDIYCEVPEFPK